MTSILAIDPGTMQSAYVVLEDGKLSQFGIVPNETMLEYVCEQGPFGADVMVVEMVESFGMPVGKEVFETVFWIGRFCEAWRMESCKLFHRVYRREIKLHLCGNSRAKDANIRQALLDKVGPQGVKKAPGPTYGLKGDMWSALAVAITFVETHAGEGMK